MFSFKCHSFGHPVLRKKLGDILCKMMRSRRRLVRPHRFASFPHVSFVYSTRLTSGHKCLGGIRLTMTFPKVSDCFSRERLRRVLRKKTLHNYISSTSSHLHICTSTSPHLHICTSTSLLIFTSASTSSHIFTSAHLHLCSSSHLHIYIICTSTSSHIFTSAHLHLC